MYHIWTIHQPLFNWGLILFAEFFFELGEPGTFFEYMLKQFMNIVFGEGRGLVGGGLFFGNFGQLAVEMYFGAVVADGQLMQCGSILVEFMHKNYYKQSLPRKINNIPHFLLILNQIFMIFVQFTLTPTFNLIRHHCHIRISISFILLFW